MSPTTRSTSAGNVLAAKDTNVTMGGTAEADANIKPMEYHRQVLQSKMQAQKYENTTTAGAAAGAPAPDAATATAAAAPHPAVSKLTSGDSSSNNYVSPSDEIMSPCTAKLNALRNKQVGKVKPKSLFAQASSKRLRGSEGLFGSKADAPSGI